MMLLGIIKETLIKEQTLLWLKKLLLLGKVDSDNLRILNGFKQDYHHKEENDVYINEKEETEDAKI